MEIDPIGRGALYRTSRLPGAGLAGAGMIAAAAALGCSSSSDPFRVAAAVVYGTVTRASGGPVQGALVGGVSYHRGCSELMAAGSDIQATDASGAYRVLLRDIAYGPGPMCVQVIVFPGAGVTDTVKVTGPTLEFRDTSAGTPLDSARVDVRIP